MNEDSFEVHWPGLQKCVVWTVGRQRLRIVTLKVKDDWQGQGIGSAVVRHLQRRGMDIELLPVSPDGRDKELLRFYSRLGFVPDCIGENLIWQP